MKKILNSLYVTIPDIYLSLDGENAVLQKDRQEIGRVPLHNIDRILVFGYRGVSPALMGKCVDKGIELVFLSPQGKFLARVEGGVNGNVLLRKEQYRISDDKKRSLEVARNMILGKVYNSRQLIMRMIRDHSLRMDVDFLKQKTDFLAESLEKCQQVKDLDSLRGLEGESASVYFSAINEMILQQKEDFVYHVRSDNYKL